MKKKIFILCMALAWTVTLMAQNIAVVNGSNTDIYHTLTEAIEGAAPGSVIYLPGGGFPISDDVKITKPLTIIGIGHYAKSGNTGGISTISGNLFFNSGSDRSAIMGCYITGNVNLGEENASVNDILIRYCNLNSVQVKNSSCSEVVVNQNYIRNLSNFSSSGPEFTNNICFRLSSITCGTVSNNIFTHVTGYNEATISSVKNSVFSDNIILNNQSDTYGYYSTFNNCSNNSYSGNMVFRYQYNEQTTMTNGVINMTGKAWNEVFVFANGGAITPASDFHFKDNYQQYSNCGIYGGDGFNDKQMAPIPYIVAKHIDEQTDASGNLKIKIRVKASGEE